MQSVFFTDTTTSRLASFLNLYIFYVWSFFKVYKMASSSKSQEVPAPDKPTVLVVLGMAGSGKTTFVQVRVL